MLKPWTWLVCLFGFAACYESALVELDTSSQQEPATDTADSDTESNSYESSDGEPQDSATGTSQPDSENTADVDTLFTERDPHYCDDLGWDDCRDAPTECGRMYLVEVQHVLPNGVAVVCDGESLFYGCAPLKYCYDNIFLALDPNGRCWLMSSGCLPDEPGWQPALDNVLCAPPIWTETCIE